jgi:hypothetical protein
MIDLAPIFLRESIPDLVSSPPTDGGLRTWIANGTYGIGLGASPGDISLSGVTSNDFFPHLFFDYCRFAMAAHESLHISFSTAFDRRATAWTLINRYYAAFFSAHALLRAHGRGVMWIDASEASRLERLGVLYIGAQFKMRKGGYAFDFNTGNGYNAELKLSPLNYGGSSHDEFWRYFLSYLSEFGAKLLGTGVANAAQTVARFDEVRQIVLTPSGHSVWLSFMRNEINYQHKFGTWFPFKPQVPGAGMDKRILKQSNAAIDLSVNPTGHPLKSFNAVTCCLAVLNSDFALLLKERAGTGAARLRAEWNRLMASVEMT